MAPMIDAHVTASRHLDHCVLPTADLETARQRLTALGFTVAPEGRHPFGTRNACVYFTDGTFLEPLSVGSKERVEQAVNRGNPFVLRDQSYRFRRGEEGFSALVLSTRDASADHADFRRAGISAGRILRFSRGVRDLEGKMDKASFKLAFAADPRAPDAFFFTCERVRTPSVDRTALQHHANGATAICQVVMTEINPGDFSRFMEILTGNKPELSASAGMEIAAGDHMISVLDPERLLAEFALKAGHARGLQLRAIVFSVPDIVRTRNMLESNGVMFRVLKDRLVVEPHAGQGAAFAFEEARNS